jgi:signal transduction histidine kinase
VEGLVVRHRLLGLATVAGMVAQTLLVLLGHVPAWTIAGSFTLLIVTLIVGFTAQSRTAALARRVAEADGAHRQLAESRAQYEKLQLLQRDKDSLVQLIVHDMRSPISATILSLEYLSEHLKRLPNTESLIEAADDALTASTNVSDMISQILDTAKLEEGRITLHSAPLAARELLNTAQGLAQVRARRRQLQMDVEVVPEGLTTNVDARLFPRLLENLVSNALRHTPPEGRILLQAVRQDGQVVIAVHNSGAPIAAGEREKIFDKFQQGNGEARRLSGWGLGLYFCRLVAEAHGGHIRVEDVPGWTTSFVIRLPA